jgi:two-component system phosphate regulon sensor histidine kinase PhoR
MRPTPFLWKLLAGYGLVVLPTLVLLGELVAAAVERDFVAAETERLETATGLLTGSAIDWLSRPEDGDGPRVVDRLRSIGAGTGLRLTVFDADGRVVADSADVPSRVEAERARTEILRARADGRGTGLRTDAVSGRTTSYLAVRIPGEGGAVGFLRAGVDRDPLFGLLRDLRTNFVLAAVGALLLALGIGFVQVRLIEGPVGQLTAVARAMAEGDFERPVPRLEGETFDGLAAALARLAVGSRERMDMVATDRNKVVAILGVMVEGVVAIDVNERIVHMNVAAARILGTQAANTEGRRVLEVTRVREVQQILAKVLHSGREEQAELRVVQPPRDRHVEIHGTPLHDADGEIAGAVLMLHDVTDLRRLEAIRRDFVANVSHELKTPITAIRGLVETVLDDDAMDPGLRSRFLGRIKEQSHRLSTLVSDLLTLSRLESAGQIAELVPVDLRSTVRDCSQGHGQIAEDRRIALHVEMPAEPVRVLGDADSLRLLVGNLIDNAIKYTPEQGQVWVRLGVDGSTAVLDVVDDGIGIERKHLDRIFQRFYRVDKARSRELGGTGLGLSIVKHVCMAHGGEVSVESQPGEGSRFRVRLPLA